MEWSERMNAAVDYIEDNLAGEIDFAEAANRSFCSTFHFQRMFLALSGITPAEYARQRRLTLAATELSSNNARVIDIAMKYGYTSPDSFTRAFRNLHGITPQAAREPGVTLTAFPRISFNIVSNGGKDMDYKIIEKPAFPVALTVRQFTNIDGQCYKDIPEWWEEFLASPDCEALTALSGDKPGIVTGGVMLGVCYGEVETGEFYYGIGVELPEGASPGKFEKMEIPATTWAVFDCTLANVQDVTKRIFGEWYVSTGYEHPGGPDLEVYLSELSEGSEEDIKCEIWAPVIKK
ncbi:GyrI-like domain-containing protein [Chloroflexota bacterium]